ncbi:putative membrane protein F35D11.3 [Caenorhabditis elegans]|uniref:Uncharacterized membrane protein F35D11.3 n=1 Tax=Caenorhabditis elegans TaxID=6239 RepID=TMCO4_CAEEL|nr:putative membrane protein F35D11.3 [Caenorhabditis elegans]Q20035.2 RecName: Full=Uncharacterized membrane protein F35D11.3 [Caenorhabditis elegans]CCD70531.1 Uncharacterized membrane protein F35D11.3 [Caenorhabditis elegans]|eukprot:NP_494812.2 Uncharacterized membrane protein F35D11.3 [Caenorhabditis elegans]
MSKCATPTPSTSSNSSDEAKRSPQPMSRGFPQRNMSTTSSNGSNSPRHRSLETPIVLQPATRFALANLTTTVLRLDFWDDNDPNSIFFCKSTFNIVTQCLDLPEKVIKTVKTHLEGEEDLTDIAPMIMSVREDPVYKTEGSTPFLASLLVAFVNQGNYDSRYRVFLRHLTTLLGVVWTEFEDVEDSLASTLLEEQFVESEHSRTVREKTARNKKIKRYLMIGAAGGVGGVLIGLTGGLAAPLVAASAGMLIGGGAVAGLATTAGAAVLGTTMGVAGAGFTGYKMKKRVGAIEEFSVETLSEGVSLSCSLVVSGWIESDTSPDQAFVHQWRHLRHTKEQYTLRYESNYLMELGNAIEYLMSFAVSVAIQQTLLETALAGLVSAVAWPVALMSVSSVLDNPWNVCVSRAAEVGEQLAEVLLSRSHGKRPITLIGFSLGARVIFHCLLTMSKRSESVGIIEDVILLGAPVTASPKEWSKVCTVVSGRVINGYCETDWLLRFLYRTMSAQFRIAGTGPIDNRNSKKIYNYNLSHIVKGHMDYSKRLTEVLNAVGVKVGPHSEDSVVDLTQLEGPHEATGQAEEAINYQSTGEEEEHPIVHPINLENIHEVKVLDSPHKNEF